MRFKRVRHNECAGDLATFKLEAASHFARLFRVAMWLVRDQAKAEWLVGETLTQALRKHHQFEAGASLCVWLLRMMYAVNKQPPRSWGTRARPRLVADTTERITGTLAFETRTPAGITEEEVLRALGSLPLSCQEVMVLSEIEELTYEEVADVLGLSVNLVMVRLSQARKAMRTELAGYANRRDSRCVKANTQAFTD